jgi:hypothetical protein
VSALKDGRRLLATDLRPALEELGVTVCDTVPEALEGYTLVLQAADPYLTPGDTFAGDWTVAYDLILCVELLSNAQAIEDLEDLLPPLLAALEATEYGVDNVGRPGPVNTSEWVAHALTVTVSRFITL